MIPICPQVRLVFSTFIVCLFALVTSPSANGTTITFSGLTGGNGDPFNSIVESGYSVIATNGFWRQGHASGNPVPSIFSNSNIGQIQLKGPIFNLLSFQTNDGSITSGVSTATYSIDGFLNDLLVLNGSGNISPQYETNLSPNALQALDRVLITFNRGQAVSYNIDNIEVRSAQFPSVPEPSSFFVFTILVGGTLFNGIRKSRPLQNRRENTC